MLEPLLAGLANLDYLTADLNPARATVQLDVTEIPWEDNWFDVILCNHVLEHVPDDRRAMSELHRVLRPGGFAILQSPVRRILEKTHEDSSIVSPAERRRAFGQEDHVRRYGRDYADRLEAAGFRVQEDPWALELPAEQVDRWGLKPEPVFRCSKEPPP